jgi:hypothetical protein
VKIYLLRLDEAHAFFYAEPGPELPVEPAPALSGSLIGWLDRKWRLWRQRLAEAESRTGRVLRSLEHRMLRFVAADEAMLRTFRTAKPEILIHPENFPVATILRLWRHYLAREQRRHQFWLLINLVLLPPAVLLAVLPGPNIFGFWFAFRVAGHALALAGIAPARRTADLLVLEPCPILDKPLNGPDGLEEPQVDSIASTCGLTQLRSYLERRGREGYRAGTIATVGADQSDRHSQRAERARDLD